MLGLGEDLCLQGNLRQCLCAHLGTAMCVPVLVNELALQPDHEQDSIIVKP